MQRERRIIHHPGLQPLWDSLERERRQQQVVAVSLMIVGLALAIGGVIFGSTVAPIAGGALATVALWWLYRIVSNQPLATVRRQLHERPEQVVWVYATVTERMPFGFRFGVMGTLYFVESGGGSQSFSLKPAELKLVTRTLKRVLPHAKFGYTEERDLEFRGEVTRIRGRGGHYQGFP